MSLIEQLGGYEKAKAFLDATSYTINELLMMQRSGLRPHHVEKALLQYRREHNIFEVGDDVVILTLALGNTYSWKVESFVESYELIELSQVCQPNQWVHITEITHATDEEIKAGKRLELSL